MKRWLTVFLAAGLMACTAFSSFAMDLETAARDMIAGEDAAWGIRAGMSLGEARKKLASDGWEEVTGGAIYSRNLDTAPEGKPAGQMITILDNGQGRVGMISTSITGPDKAEMDTILGKIKESMDTRYGTRLDGTTEDGMPTSIWATADDRITFVASFAENKNPPGYEILFTRMVME